MDRLWAPWRIKYLRKMGKGCIFCQAIKSRGDKGNYLLKRSRYSFSMLNIFPYNNGHMMVAPRRHVSGLDKLGSAEILDLLELVNYTCKALNKCLRPNGYNIGMNVGRVAGAGFPGHLHVHIVPRWEGDTNFMPVISRAKVISQSLDELYRRLKRC